VTCRTTLCLIAAALVSLPAHAGGTLKRYPNGWFAGGQGNQCLARLDHDGVSFTIGLTRWDDLSDHLVVWKAGLKPLMTETYFDAALGEERTVSSGLTPEEEEREAEAGFHLVVSIDGQPLEGLPNNYQMPGSLERPGVTWRIALDQQPFLRALARGTTLSLHHRGELVAELPVAPAGRMAAMLKRCVDKPPM
jgi:hypothetical protein